MPRVARPPAADAVRQALVCEDGGRRRCECFAHGVPYPKFQRAGPIGPAKGAGPSARNPARAGHATGPAPPPAPQTSTERTFSAPADTTPPSGEPLVHRAQHRKGTPSCAATLCLLPGVRRCRAVGPGETWVRGGRALPPGGDVHRLLRAHGRCAGALGFGLDEQGEQRGYGQAGFCGMAQHFVRVDAVGVRASLAGV